MGSMVRFLLNLPHSLPTTDSQSPLPELFSPPRCRAILSGTKGFTANLRKSNVHTPVHKKICENRHHILLSCSDLPRRTPTYLGGCVASLTQDPSIHTEVHIRHVLCTNFRSPSSHTLAPPILRGLVVLRKKKSKVKKFPHLNAIASLPSQ